MTDVRMDMKINFDALDSSFNPNLLDHSGFKKQYESIKTRIRQYVSDKCDQSRQLLVTGHSLGGSFATFCSLDLIK